MIGLHVGATNPRQQVERHGGDCAQVFLASPLRWAGPDPRREWTCDDYPTWTHAAYLVNVCADDEDVRHRSWQRLARELRAAANYGALGVVVHPGTCADANTGRSRWAQFLDSWGPFDVPVILENSAGRGIAQTPEQLFLLWYTLREYGAQVCIDSAHAWAAGWRPHLYARQFMRMGGRKPIALLHANDSARGQGSGQDAHANVGDGEIGLFDVVELIRETGAPAVCETPSPSSVGVLKAVLGGAQASRAASN